MKEAIGEKKFGWRKIVFWDFLNGTKTFFEVSVWVWSRRGLEDEKRVAAKVELVRIRQESSKANVNCSESGDLNVISGFPALMRI